MITYIVRRLFQLVIVLIGVTIITFVIMFAIPGDPARQLAGGVARDGEHDDEGDDGDADQDDDQLEQASDYVGDHARTLQHPQARLHPAGYRETPAPTSEWRPAAGSAAGRHRYDCAQSR